VPRLNEPRFDELDVGDLDGAPIEDETPANAGPYLFDDAAIIRAAEGLEVLADPIDGNRFPRSVRTAAGYSGVPASIQR
jgi:hypothetical protein